MVKYFIRSLFFFQIIYAQGSVLLVGGGSENYGDWSDAPYGWLVQHAPNKKILVLHYSTVSTFLPDYFKSLGAVQSVSIAITSASANDSATFKTILEYDGIFLRGGDQWEYVKQWKGTLTEQAITMVFQRGGAVGGTSAGSMVLSKIIADAKTTSVDPRTSLRSPLNAGITFTEDFFCFFSGILCDTHFYERGRLSRLLAMLAVYHQQTGKWITGVGIDDATALGISSNGSAEAFGSGVVSFLVPSQSTTKRLQAGKPLGLSEVTLRQFTKGTTVNLPDATVKSLPPMGVYTPESVSSAHMKIVLDGGSTTAEWSTTNGSLMKIVNSYTGDTVGICTSTPLHSNITTLRDFFTVRNIPTSVIPVFPSSRNTIESSTAFKNRHVIIIANVPADSLSFFTDSASVSGSAFRDLTGRTLALLGDAASYAGSAFVNKLEVTTTAAYRGRLTNERGLGIIKGLMILPRLYEADSYIENRASGLPWGIGRSYPSFGVYLDNNSHCVIENNTITAYGATPAVIFDLRTNSLTAFPLYVASGGIGPRQNAAFNAAKVIVLPDSSTINIATSSSVQLRGDVAVPLTLEMLNIYPNPFNPSATIEFILQKKEFVTVTISDILGRTHRTIAHREFDSGTHQLSLNGTTLASGLYLISIRMDGLMLSKRAMLIK